jgi:hypothetical protein
MNVRPTKQHKNPLNNRIFELYSLLPPFITNYDRGENFLQEHYYLLLLVSFLKIFSIESSSSYDGTKVAVIKKLKSFRFNITFVVELPSFLIYKNHVE